RQTVPLPGVLKQTFFQSPYLISRTILRWPRDAISGSRALSVALPGGAACWAVATAGRKSTVNVKVSKRTNGFVQQALIIEPPLTILVEELTDQRRPLRD